MTRASSHDATVLPLGGLQAFPEDLKDKSAAAILVNGTKEIG